MNLKYFLLFFICINTSLPSFAQSDIENKMPFEIKFSTLLETQNYVAILKMFKEFESLPSKTPLDYQIYFASKGKYYSSIARKDDAVTSFNKSLSYAANNAKSQSLVGAVYERIADVNFTACNYDKADKYAQLADPFIKRSQYYQYINVHSIIGNCCYNRDDFKKCGIEYEKVRTLIIEKKDFCKEPEILMKIAKLEDKAGNFKKAIDDIDKCIATAKKCEIGVYLGPSYVAKYHILKNNRKFEAAIVEFERMIKVDDSLGARAKNQKIYDMQIDFENKIKEKENKTLKLYNLKEKELVAKQKYALLALIAGLMLLTVLVAFLFKFNKKQKENSLTIASNNKELNRLNILNQKIFTVISHDFKAPITTLRLFLKSEKISTTENPMFAQYVNEANFQLDQSDAMMNNLLDWAKMELNLTTGPTNTDLRNAVNSVISQLQAKANDKNLTIINELSANISLNFPSEVIIIVVRNILANAIKFSFDDGNIEFTYANNCLEIKDYGKGIAPDKLNRLFKSDVEAGFGTKFETGFGIGLFLSNELMVKHGGFITVTNNENEKGCTFFINF